MTFSQLFRLPIYCYGIGQKEVYCWTYSFPQIQQGLARLLFLAFLNNLFLYSFRASFNSFSIAWRNVTNSGHDKLFAQMELCICRAIKLLVQVIEIISDTLDTGKMQQDGSIHEYR